MQELLPPILAAGTALAHYEVRSVLGTGGMGTVYLAHDTALDRPVALKVLKSEVAGDPELADRFVREARAAARVSHPNLAHVYFVGTSGDRPFFAMEYCPGETLEALVRGKGPLPLDPGLAVLAQAARGLAAAHGVGVVHRDVKPSNLMVLPDGSVKVTDFGLAKSLRGDVQATAGRMMGTPTYMSPEQVRGKEVDARTDIYLLGLTGYFLFAGKPAYASDQVGEVINDQINTPLPDLATGREDLPPALGAFLGRMCAKDPAQRPASMEEVAAGLEALRPRLMLSAPIMGRVFAAGIDVFLFGVCFGGAGYLLLLVAGIQPSDTLGQDPMPGWMQRVIALAVAFLLGPFAEVRHGASVGTQALEFRVVRRDGARLRWRDALLRFVILYPIVFVLPVPAKYFIFYTVPIAAQTLAVCVGSSWYFFAHGRTLSDVLTKTRVVYQGPWQTGRAP